MIRVKGWDTIRDSFEVGRNKYKSHDAMASGTFTYEVEVIEVPSLRLYRGLERGRCTKV
jgi:hypothetical protein